MFSQASVILFRGGVVAETPRQTSPWADIPLGKHPPLGRHPSTQCMLGYTLPSACRETPPLMATAADGMHPTGMHSCFKLTFHNHTETRQMAINRSLKRWLWLSLAEAETEMEKNPVGSFPFRSLRFYFSLKSMLMISRRDSRRTTQRVVGLFSIIFPKTSMKMK